MTRSKVASRVSRIQLPSIPGIPRPSATFQEEQLLQRAGLADLDDTLTEYRTAIASEFCRFLQKTQVELTDHACKVILLSNVMVRGVRRSAKSTREEVRTDTQATPTEQTTSTSPLPVRDKVSSRKEEAFACGEDSPRSSAATKTSESPTATKALCNGTPK
uniref:Uncharacterized protein n=1 Tax=Chrysotila carterae TaxID=13221 RepID=A0A7S4B1E3_CHRCT